VRVSIRSILLAFFAVAFVGLSAGCGGTWCEGDYCECHPYAPGCDGTEPPPPATRGLEAFLISPFGVNASVGSMAPGHHTPFLCPSSGAARNCVSFDATPSGSTNVYFDAQPSNLSGVTYEVQGMVVAGGARNKYACDRNKWGFTSDQQQYDAGGYALEVEVQVRPSYDYFAPWTPVGRVVYAHLSGIDVYDGQSFGPGTRIGTLFQGSYKNGCWGGLHVHMEMQSSAGRAPCYASVLEHETTASTTVVFGMYDVVAHLGDCRDTVGVCDPSHLYRSTTRGGTDVEQAIPACVAGASGYTVALCDGTYGLVFANPDGTASDFGACCFETAAEVNELVPDLVDMTSQGCLKEMGRFPCLPACVAGTSGYAVPLETGLYGVALVGPDGSFTDAGVSAGTPEDAMTLFPNLTDYTSMYWLDDPTQFACRP
jgi:hypothetical protein